MAKVLYTIALVLYANFSFAGAPACTIQSKNINGVIADYSEGWMAFSGKLIYGCTVNVRGLNDNSLGNKTISNPVESTEDKYLCDVAKSVHIERDSSVLDINYCDLEGNARLINIKINKA